MGIDNGRPGRYFATYRTDVSSVNHNGSVIYDTLAVEDTRVGDGGDGIRIKFLINLLHIFFSSSYQASAYECDLL